jgi:hypothetical protein
MFLLQLKTLYKERQLWYANQETIAAKTYDKEYKV